MPATVNISPLAKQRFFDATGIPLAGGKLFSYAAGTTNKQNTYTDSTGATPNANPTILDSGGYCNLWFDQSLTYKVTLSPATDTDPPTNPIWTVDHLNSVASPIAAALAGPAGAALVGGGILVVASMAALKAIVNVTAPGTCLITGFATPGDGGWGIFWWNSVDVRADDGGTIIQPNAGGNGRWNKL